MRYKVSTVEKKNVVEKEFYVKDGKTAIIKQGYRWGYFVTEDPVDVEEIRATDELMIYDYDVIDHSFDDGCWIDFHMMTKLVKMKETLLKMLGKKIGTKVSKH